MIEPFSVSKMPIKFNIYIIHCVFFSCIVHSFGLLLQTPFSFFFARLFGPGIFLYYSLMGVATSSYWSLIYNIYFTARNNDQNIRVPKILYFVLSFHV